MSESLKMEEERSSKMLQTTYQTAVSQPWSQESENMSFNICIHITWFLFHYINTSMFSTETGALHISHSMPVYKTVVHYMKVVGISCTLQ